VVNLKTEAGVRTFESLATAISDLVLEFGGALSGEHGDGYVRSPFMRKMFGPVLYEAFREIKKTFDPHGILNPGKIVDAPPLVSNLRYGPAYRSTAPQTWFDYSAWGGMSGAVEMCSGLGACRKTLDGTMCPSYMATKEEAHSTRGRANTLRLVMAGRLDESGLGDEGVREVLDLCLECRACKAECPVGVDVARFKSEFLADYWKRHGTPLRARALGNVRTLSALASRAPGLANALIGSGPVRALNARLLGLHPARALPRWASRTLESQWSGTTLNSVGQTPAFLFNDTFTNYFHPEIGLAARRVIEATGTSVGLAANVCCSRPLISQGLLKEARELAARNTKLLSSLIGTAKAAPYDSGRRAPLSGVPAIVFLEPSCLSALREDVPALLRGEEQQQALRVAERCVSFEEFLGQSEGRTLPLGSGPSRILLHGHCHQKSMGGLPPAKALLERITGTEVTDLDAGCCGMAGSFGYAREHFDVSRQIGERRLLPAARALKADEVLVAAGTSCRQQVSDFTGVRALHPAELLATLLTKPLRTQED
jgi:Fe-S oxidoreductase